MQTLFQYKISNVAALRSSISRPRLQRYEAIADGDIAQAFQLYVWNTALSASLYGPLQGLEVTLRNKIHDRFTTVFGARWYDKPEMKLGLVQQRKVADVQQSLLKRGERLDPSQVVAQLSFGFWVGLFGPKYENNLWRPHLRTLFVNAPRPFLRKDAHIALEQARSLRNRIAHHEPILHQPLLREYGSILATIGWLCRDTCSWVAHHSRFDAVYAARP